MMMTELKESTDCSSAEAEHLVTAARDALSDEMVSRLAGFCSEGMDLVDRVQRSGLPQALPVLAEMVDNGDLDRIFQLARVYQSFQDALSDEMVGRLAETVGEGLSMLDRFNRGGGGRLLQMLERLEATGALERILQSLPALLDKLDRVVGLLNALEVASTAKQAPPGGGLGGLWNLMTQRETQQALQFLTTLSQQMRDECAKG
ncbi:MAG: hypothetical protein HO274_03975 [Ferrovum myxofaciens]|uniref:hypothetical protein n=1 Tax=Ferrovum myxofaciens TaxID=416213 RepID=UPI002356FD6E|nr:hypothetical protein [Ferrovum myxofaciens]QKE40560.1 MAG: hypothetical protein HO274_03975 [Ferrovum myxofaciens]